MTPSRARILRRLTPLLFLVGAVVMVVFERWFTLLAGVVLMLAFVILGAFVIADPRGFLDRDADADAGADAGDAVVGSAEDGAA